VLFNKSTNILTKKEEQSHSLTEHRIKENNTGR